MLAPEATVHQLGADRICRWVQEEVISQASHQSLSQSVLACVCLSWQRVRIGSEMASR